MPSPTRSPQTRRTLARRVVARRLTSRRGLLRRGVVLVAKAAIVAMALATACTSIAGAAGWSGRVVASEPANPSRTPSPAASSVASPLRPTVPQEGMTGPQADSLPQVATRPAADRWAWPLDPRPAVLRRFEAPPGPYAAGHRGVDLAARPGQPVLSPTAGVVTFSGTVAGQPVVVVAHPGGLRSTFQPVTGTRPVGAAVARGDQVGVVTATTGHCASASCLHWGVLRGPAYLDPLRFVQGGPVVLLPLPPVSRTTS